jgi:hypothetical protein
MTSLRNFALGISRFVVRYASPGSKEWAEGLAREVAFIESDWSALAWALGSMKVLLDYREAPLASLQDAPAAARRFVEIMRFGAGLGWAILFGPLYVWKLFYATSWPERAGCVLVVFSSIAAATLLLTMRRRLKDPRNDNIYEDDVACAQFYRAELERYYCSTVWIASSVLLGWSVGIMLAARGGLYFHAVFSAGIVLLALAAAPFIAVAQRINRRKIERLDALLAERC